MNRGEHARVGVDDVSFLREVFDKGIAVTKEMAQRDYNIHERKFRACVSQLRESGYPVISTSEQGSTYRKANSRRELEAFVDRELISRTRDLEEQIRALREGADRYFGTDQLALAI